MRGYLKPLPIVDVNPKVAHSVRLYPIQPVRTFEDDSFCFPSPQFQNIVAFYYQIHLDDKKSRYIYPTGNTGVVCRLDCRQPTSYLVGTPTYPRKAEYVVSNGDYFVALFWLGVGYCLFPTPPAELTDSYFPMAEVFPDDSQRFTEEMALAQSFQRRVQIFEGFLSKIMAESRQIPKQHARLLYNSCLASESSFEREMVKQPKIDLSSRQIRRLYLKYLGIPPKLYSRIFRYQKALRFMNAYPGDCMAGLAIDHGYFDQSHFIKEFRRFQGETPVEFLRKLINN